MLSPGAPTSTESLQGRDVDCISTSLDVARRYLESRCDPRDHRRIAESWKAMLQNRFISPQTISILGFYLDSVFDRVEPTQQMQMRLPSNSCLTPREIGAPDKPDFDPLSCISFHTQPNPPPSREVLLNAPLPDSTTAIQLARRLHTIIQCKSSMWEAYVSLYRDSPTLPHLEGHARITPEDEFDFHWSNWVE
jgi:hypothetical protein